MGDEKDNWKVKTLEEILQEKKRRKEQEEKVDVKRLKNLDDRDSKRDSLEEGELQEHKMEITIRNSPHRREGSIEDRGEEDDSLAIKPPQQTSKKEKSHHRKEERRKEKRRHRSRSAEAMMHHRGLNDEYAVKVKIHHRSHSPVWRHAERFELDERKNVKEERYEEKDPPSDLQDISESEIKTTSGESTSGSATASEAESSSEGSEESLSPSEVETEPSPGEITEEEEHSDEERQNGNHLQMVTESKFDHDSEESVEEEDEEEMEEEDDEEEEEESPISNAPTEEEYVPDSPPPSPVEPKKELPQYLPALQGCRSVEEFQCLNRIEEGTYGVVYRAKDKKTDEIVALKRLKMEKEKEGFPITSLREINTILKAQHPNIVTVREIVVGSNMDKIYIVMNYVEHDLKSLMETMKQPFLPGEVKTLMIQLLKGVRHLHDNWILHRDLKTSNLLLSHSGILKIGDFGLAREYGSPLKPYTPVVVTLWYRTPELLLGAKEYSTAIDLWSVGCIFAEFLTQKPLFPGKSEIDQINKIFKELGTPSEKIWPGYNDLPAVKKMTFTEYPFNNLRKRFGALLSDQGFDLMNKFLTYCPAKRITAEEALKHDYFRETPLPIESAMFPTWPAKSEQQRVKRGTSPRPPEGGLGYSQLGDDDLKDTGFHLTTTNQGASAAGPGFSLKF
ncbi:cyclin-dependent kinase 11B isoform X4 [Leucoraja erinacea]|uniref:cyclin-dependent kinase 11B isoform X4 n=1 Tax=Leucoraja erinaceus TaxID=7782 RepID=UPI002456906C|nr:cyclin-dependent kinase 11B isoform X4 [Leucoraja erinacea]